MRAPFILAETGDSGGPLFRRVSSTGVRDPLGIASVTAPFRRGEDESTIWVDITTNRNADFIRTNARDTTRSQLWLSRHQKRELWWGEVDYTGPCDTAVDSDCDHWSNVHDNCPRQFNPGQEDTDDDGLGDACDNCVSAFNPGQDNCNETVERLYTPTVGPQFLGDACDPVPCPKSTVATGDYENETCRSLGSIPGPCSPTAEACNCTSQRIERTLNSRPLGPFANSVAPGIETSFRFCQVQENPTGSTEEPPAFDCVDSTAVVNNLQLTAVEPATLNPRFPWHAVTVGRGTFSPPRVPRRGATVRWDYGATVADNTWFFERDFDYWRTPGNPAIPLETRLPGCLSAGGIGGQNTCLNGYFWIHGETAIGGSARGESGPSSEYANTHVYWRPAGVELAYCTIRTATIPVSNGRRAAPAAAFETFGEMLWPGSDDRLLNVDRQATVFIAPTTFGPAAYLESDTAVSLSRSSPDCGGDAIEDPSTFLSRRWISAVEPAGTSRRLVDAAASNPFAVSMSSDFRSAAVRATQSSGRVVFHGSVNDRSRTASAVASAEPPIYSATTAVYTQQRGGVFLVGGEDAAGQSTSEIWFVGLDGASGRIDDGSLVLGRVLAATYSFDDARLYIIDETTESAGRGARARVRLLTVDMVGRVETLYSTRRSLDRVTPFLSVDRDGSILLAVAREKRFSLYRISGAPCATLRRLRGGPGELVRNPIVDAQGYSFVLAGENASLRVERRPVSENDDEDNDDGRGRCWPRGRRGEASREGRCASAETSRWCREDDERVFGELF